jgi:hypothetical protein
MALWHACAATAVEEVEVVPKFRHEMRGRRWMDQSVSCSFHYLVHELGEYGVLSISA